MERLNYLEGNKTDVKKFLPLLGMLKRSFPEVKVIISKARMIEDFIEAGIDPGKADTVKGYTDGNTVVLNPTKLDAETPIHEFGHIWAQATRQLRPDLYAKGVELVKKSPYYIETLEKSKDKDSVYYGYSKARIEEEAMATAIGQAGQQFFKEQSDAKAWDALRKKIWDWIGQRLGMKKVEDLTFDQFNKLAVTEILTGERFITEGQSELMENSLIYNALQVPVGSTRDYSPTTKPAVEIDTHGVFNGAALRREALNTVNRYWDELNNGGWIGYTTGSYGEAVKGTPKFNAKLNAKIESKVKTLTNEFAKEGYTFMRDPKNPGFHIVRKAKTYDFLEITPQDIEMVSTIANIALAGSFVSFIGTAALDKGQYDAPKGEVDSLSFGKKALRTAGLPVWWIIQAIGLGTSMAGYLATELIMTPFGQAGWQSVRAQKRFDKFKEEVLKKNEAHLKRPLNKDEKEVIDAFANGIYHDYQHTPMNKPYKYKAKDDAKIKEIMKRGNVGSDLNAIQFLEETPRVQANTAEKKAAINKINKTIKNALKPYKTQSPYKLTRVDETTRKVLEATKKDLAKRGESLSLADLNHLQGLTQYTARLGKKNIQALKKQQNAKKESIRSDVDQMINQSSGLNLDNLTANQAKVYAAKRRSWKNRILTPKKLSDMLSPASNSDFYTLLYDLMPKGDNRLSSQKRIKEALIDPLERANVEHIERSTKMENTMEVLQNYLNENGVDLKKPSGIKIEGEVESYELTNGELVKLYNYAKDPRTHKQLTDGDFDIDTIKEAIDKVNSNEVLKNYAQGVVNIYADVTNDINAKLESHGRETIAPHRIESDKLSDESKEILNSIYGDKLPLVASYTPLTAEGTDTDTEMDALLASGNQDIYTVMSGNLKKRTGGGEALIKGTSPDSDFQSYLRGPVRTMSYLDFARNASDFFGPKQLTKMKAAYGDTWTDSMKDSLRRIVTGRNVKENTTQIGKFVNTLLTRQVGGIMFFNMRSGLLQMISTVNYLIEDGDAVKVGKSKARAKERAEVADFIAGPKTKRNKLGVLVRDTDKASGWWKQRGRGKTDLNIDEIFEDGNDSLIDRAIRKGYAITKLGDKTAILYQGKNYMTGKYVKYQAQGLSKDEAMQAAYKDFISVTEETQQSTRAERLGKDQTTGLGKFILAFANTPMQYNRKMARALKDISGLRGVKGPEAQARAC